MTLRASRWARILQNNRAATGYDPNTCAYNANGNMTTRTEGITAYSQLFDRESRLTSVVAISGSTRLTTTFIYNSDSAGPANQTQWQ